MVTILSTRYTQYILILFYNTNIQYFSFNIFTSIILKNLPCSLDFTSITIFFPSASNSRLSKSSINRIYQIVNIMNTQKIDNIKRRNDKFSIDGLDFMITSIQYLSDSACQKNE